MLRLRLPRAQSDRQRAANCPDATVQRQFTNRENVSQVFSISEVTIGAENPQRDRQIEAGAFLAHVCRRQVDRRLVKREEERAVVNGCADAFARFAHRSVRAGRRQLLGGV